MLIGKKEKKILGQTRSILKTFRYFTPLNLSKEREKFFQSMRYNPQFIYPKLPIPYLKKLERKINLIELNNNQEFISYLYLQKLKEAKLKLKLFLARGTPLITKYSITLYRVSFKNRYLANAKKDASNNIAFSKQEKLTPKDTAHKIRNYLKKYNAQDWRINLSDNIDFNFQIRPKRKLISIGSSLNWHYINLETMLAHEIDGHVLRAINARKQKKNVFKDNFPFYIKTEEGLACFLGDYLSNGGDLSKKHHAIKYLASYFAQNNSFRNTFNFFLGYGFPKDLAFQRTLRIKKGFSDTSIPGINAREAIYYEGMQEIKEYIKNNGDIKRLFAGKVGLQDLAYIPLPRNQLVPKRTRHLFN